MSSRTDQDVTELLMRLGQGETSARDDLWALVYDELRRTAGEMMKGERQGHTLQPTALVNEAFLKLAGLKRIRYRDRRHFFAIAARMMRRILVDHARAKGALKRDSGEVMTLVISSQLASMPTAEVLDLDDALSRLEEMEPEKARIVEFKFFGGLTSVEVAEVLGCSEKTVQRHWKIAKLWLHRELSGGRADAS